MFNITRLCFIAISCALLFGACSKDELPTEQNVNLNVVLEDNVSYSQMETDILNAVNDYRISKGLSRLSKVDEITFQADSHTRYMIQKDAVSHDNFVKRYETLVKEIGAKVVGENVGYGYNSAQGVVNAWIKSDGHRENIEGDYTHFGISVDQNQQGRNYFTNIFVKR